MSACLSAGSLHTRGSSRLQTLPLRVFGCRAEGAGETFSGQASCCLALIGVVVLRVFGPPVGSAIGLIPRPFGDRSTLGTAHRWLALGGVAVDIRGALAGVAVDIRGALAGGVTSDGVVTTGLNNSRALTLIDNCSDLSLRSELICEQTGSAEARRWDIQLC